MIWISVLFPLTFFFPWMKFSPNPQSSHPIADGLAGSHLVGDGEGIVLNFVNEQNRPLNSQNDAHSLQKFNLKKATVQKALDSLADSGKISFKEAGPVTGHIISELSSSRTRGKFMGFSFCVHWVFNFLAGLFFLELIEKFGVAPVYAGFGGVSTLATVFAYYFVVETKGRSLEEIEMSLNANYQETNKS
ncbi:Major facilitator superfamily protein [Perilla frutescens var. hirtella]|nr:Major facilitator superfamily protein [Perilla frutescens var. hirtella]